jgi:putative membrane protein
MIFGNGGNCMKSKAIFVWQFTIAVGALFAVATLCAQEEMTQPDNPFFRKKTTAAPSATPRAKATTKTLSEKDMKFLRGAASSGGWETATGRSAEQKAQNSATKEVAARMIADHSKTNQEMVDLGKKKGLEISTEGVKAQQITGSDFDKRYLDLVVQDHQEEISVFEKEVKSGDDADIKSWAAKTLPTIKQHLALAKGALNKLK